MATGLEVAAGVAGFISLSITLYKSCLGAIDLLETASNQDADFESIRCMLDFERFRLYQWSTRAQLDATPKKYLNWNLITDILKQLERLLTNAAELKEKYKLVDIDEDHDAKEMIKVVTRGYNSFGRLLGKFRPEYDALKKVRRPLMKAAWAASDKNKFASLIRDISYFNNALHGLLESRDLEFIHADIGNLLRDILAHSSTASELDVIKQLLIATDAKGSTEIASATDLKQIRIRLGIDIVETNENQAEGSSMRTAFAVFPLAQPMAKPKLRMLKASRLELTDINVVAPKRAIGRYRGRHVLVEWKYIPSEHESLLRPRVEGLAVLLGSITDISFHCLPCDGLVKDLVSDYFAFVFQLPSGSGNNSPGNETEKSVNATKSLERSTSPIMRSLRSLYNLKCKPSLGTRFRIALSLAETVLQLHTAGWLHKGIRSENVLFFDHAEHQWESATPLGPYLAGYEYSRLAGSEEATEAPEAAPLLDIYRHPDARGSIRPSYRKEFDMFALGCVLMEIALWEPIEDILSRLWYDESRPAMNELGGSNSGFSLFHAFRRSSPSAVPADEDSRKLRDLLAAGIAPFKSDKVFAGITFYMGITYSGITRLCLDARELDRQPESDSHSINIQCEIVEKLKDCRV